MSTKLNYDELYELAEITLSRCKRLEDAILDPEMQRPHLKILALTSQTMNPTSWLGPKALAEILDVTEKSVSNVKGELKDSGYIDEKILPTPAANGRKLRHRWVPRLSRDVIDAEIDRYLAGKRSVEVPASANSSRQNGKSIEAVPVGAGTHAPSVTGSSRSDGNSDYTSSDSSSRSDGQSAASLPAGTGTSRKDGKSEPKMPAGAGSSRQDGRSILTNKHTDNITALESVGTLVSDDAARARSEAAPRSADERARMRAALIDAAGPLLQSTTAPGLLNLGQIERLIGDGFDFELDVLPAIREVAANEPTNRGRVYAWKFFCPAVMAYAERRRATSTQGALAIVEPVPPLSNEIIRGNGIELDRDAGKLIAIDGFLDELTQSYRKANIEAACDIVAGDIAKYRSKGAPLTQGEIKIRIRAECARQSDQIDNANRWGKSGKVDPAVLFPEHGTQADDIKRLFGKDIKPAAVPEILLDGEGKLSLSGEFLVDLKSKYRKANIEVACDIVTGDIFKFRQTGKPLTEAEIKARIRAECAKQAQQIDNANRWGKRGVLDLRDLKNLPDVGEARKRFFGDSTSKSTPQ